MRDVLKDALLTSIQGPKVIVARSECMLNRQRRERPIAAERSKNGLRTVRERFGVDHDTCTGDHSCIRLSGCPSLTIAPNPDPLRREPVTKVIQSCVGCGGLWRGRTRSRSLPILLSSFGHIESNEMGSNIGWFAWRDHIRAAATVGAEVVA